MHSIQAPLCTGYMTSARNETSPCLFLSLNTSIPMLVLEVCKGLVALMRISHPAGSVAAPRGEC